MRSVTIHIDQCDSHVHMRIFVNSALAGKLDVRRM